MTSRNGARLFSAFLATSAFAFVSPAFANGQGTPVEPAPAPAPTTMAPEPAPVPVVAEAPPPAWQGFYVGAEVGYAFQSNDDNDRLRLDPTLTGNYVDNIYETNNTPTFTNFENEHRDGIDAGGRIGYDLQFDNFVVGGLLEADYQDIKNSETNFTATDYYTIERKLNFLGAGRLRAGVLVDPSWLIYATGGVAYGDLDHNFGTSNISNTFTERDDKGAWGYQVGGGIETMISPGLSVGAEYIYTSLDDKDYTVRIGHGTASALDPFILANANGTDAKLGKDRFNIQSVRATLTYHFNE